MVVDDETMYILKVHTVLDGLRMFIFTVWMLVAVTFGVYTLRSIDNSHIEPPQPHEASPVRPSL